jgi:DNA-directed RNA polymerase subunit RPC12/RpoP
MSTTEDQNILESVTLHCLRCGHRWIRRKATPPKNCPKCISPYWDKPRRKDKHATGKLVFPEFLCCKAEQNENK